MERILIIDDQPDVRLSASLLLTNHGFNCSEAASLQQALDTLKHEQFDLILLDMNYTADTTSGAEGLSFLDALQSADICIPVLVMTAWANIDIAVKAMQSGAVDFIEKPWQNRELLDKVKSVLGDDKQPVQRNQHGEVSSSNAPIAVSPAMQQLLQTAQRAARSDAPILITGEHGTGKSLLATYIHQQSPRAQQPLINVNMGAIPDNLFESELFGHKKGAFTDAREDRTGRFALASDGTLFLDEIGTLPFNLQAKLLRVLESGEYDVVGDSRCQTTNARVISATNADLDKLIADDSFRADLLFRLNTIQLELPPLRARKEDILPLASHFLSAHGEKYQRKHLQFSDDAQAYMRQHDWPGNVRELSHRIERAVILVGGDTITVEELGFSTTASAQSAAPQSSAAEDANLMDLDSAERQVIINVLNHYDGNVTDAAAHLNMSKSALYRKLSKLDIAVSRRANA